MFCNFQCIRLNLFWKTDFWVFYSFRYKSECFLNFTFMLFIVMFKSKPILYINLASYNFAELITSFNTFLSIAYDFLHIRSCRLQINIVLYLSFQSGCLLFLFLDWLPWLEPPVKYWIEMVWIGFIVFFLITGIHFQSFNTNYDDSWSLGTLYSLRKFPSISSILSVLSLCCLFCQTHLCWDDDVVFALCSINMVYT